MTNQDYMDLLERFSTGESNTQLSIKTDKNSNITDIVYDVRTDAYNIECNVMEIRNGKLIMLVPNIMDAYIAKNTTSAEIMALYRENAKILHLTELPNQISSSQIIVPYYSDNSERFQRELSGEFVLYETHVKYVHNIIEKANAACMEKMKEVINFWDKSPNM